MMDKVQGKFGRWRRRVYLHLKKNWQWDVMIFLPVMYMLIFHYIPLVGLQIAFKDYSPRAGIWDSVWVGLDNFRKFFSNYKWSQYVGNTLRISLYSIIVGFPIPIILAILLHVSERKWLKKLTQNVAYIPHFISVVVMVGILWQIFDPFSGIPMALRRLTGLEFFSSDLRVNPDAFIHMYVWSDVWQHMGWSTIIYVSALSSVSEELHEAARLDGATRWQRVRYVDLPAIMPTVCIMLIMRFGHVLSVGREKVYLMQTDMNLTQSEVISTYVYKNGLAKGELSYGTAVGLMNSVVATVLMVFVNWITKVLSKDEMGLF